MLHTHLFDMQHDYFQKKKNVLTFDPTPGVKGVCKVVCLDGTLCSIPINLISNMTTFR